MKKKYQKQMISVVFCLFLLAALPSCGFADKNPTQPSTITPSVSPEIADKHGVVPDGENTPVPANQSAIASIPSPEPTRSETKNSVKVKGLYLTGWTAGSKEKLDHFIQLTKETELNTFVIDIKNEDGIVSYASAVDEVQRYRTYEMKYDPDTLVKKLHENSIRVIGRVVCFLDPVLSKKVPDRAVKHTDGGLWREENKEAEITWLNPCDKRNWTYVVELAKEAADKGFDEIQFDYIRFPYGNKSKMDFGTEEIVKHEVINDFLSFARKEMPETTLSVDIFGIVCVSPGDREKIGQYLELIGKEMDYISPMTYPALYARGQIVNGVEFPNPDLKPYDVVYHTLLTAKRRLSDVQDYRAEVRPFLQAFTATWLKEGTWQTYTGEQYRQQIKAVEDAGYEQWIFWDAVNRYDASAFSK